MTYVASSEVARSLRCCPRCSCAPHADHGEKPSRNVLISNTSEPPSQRDGRRLHTVTIWPGNFIVKSIDGTRAPNQVIRRLIPSGRRPPRSESQLIDGRLTERDLESSQDEQDPSEETRKRTPRYFERDVPLIAICAHGARDARCGTMGSLLEQQFREYIAANPLESNLEHAWNPSAVNQKRWTPESGFRSDSKQLPATVTAISHVGGHVWAGNVIIYFPKHASISDQPPHPLSGKGVWYGRVEPKHVSGIMEETVRNGRVIKELLRGVCSPQGPIPQAK